MTWAAPSSLNHPLNATFAAADAAAADSSAPDTRGLHCFAVHHPSLEVVFGEILGQGTSRALLGVVSCDAKLAFLATEE